MSLKSAGSLVEIEIDDARNELQGLQARRADQSLTLRGATLNAGSAMLRRRDSTLQLELSAVQLSGAGAKGARAADHLALAEFSIDGSSAALSRAGDGKLSAALQGVAAAASGAEAAQGGVSLRLGKAAAGARSVSLEQAAGRLQLSAQAANASLAGLDARRAEQRLVLAEAGFQAETLSAGAVTSADDATARASLDGVALNVLSLALMKPDADVESGRVQDVKLAAKSLRMDFPGNDFGLVGRGLAAELSNALWRRPRETRELLRLGSATLAGGALDLRDRSFAAETVTLAQVEVSTWLDEQGQLNLVQLFAGDDRGEADAPPSEAGANAPWRVAIEDAQVEELAVAFEDRRDPPLPALRLSHVQARATALDTAAAEPMQLAVRAELDSGGRIDAQGTAHADTGAADLKIAVDAVDLAPLQPLLARFATLGLKSGNASATGRLRYGGADSGALLRYEGGIALRQVRLDEPATQRPFLSWDSVATDDAVLSLQPHGLDIGELRAVAPAGRLIIADDGSVNVADVLVGPPADGAEQPSTAGAGSKAAAAVFPVSIARLRVSDGVLEFADLSLRPQFATRMHELRGVVTGLGSDPKRTAQVQLDARVDEYGSVKIGGQVSVFDPERLTDIEMNFRNLQLGTLSPYIARFAGHRVDSGRLQLDLAYKLNDRRLLGRNKIVLQQVVLGEKVASPDALDIPLDMALALLRDSKGVIDIALPVSGDLDNPQFDYGEIIGNAVGKLLGGIVSAPFAALGAAFGGGDQGLDAIHFDGGSHALAPPERQKLAILATALKQRPALALVVPPTYSKAQDEPALRTLALRGEIVASMGIALAPDEDPGPVDAANPRAQRAIAKAFQSRYAAGVFDALRNRAVAATESAPVAQPATSPAAPPAEAAAPAAFYQTLLERMISEHAVTDDTLTRLATRRGEAIVEELVTVGGLPALRASLGEPAPDAEPAGGDAVMLQLRLRPMP